MTASLISETSFFSKGTANRNKLSTMLGEGGCGKNDKKLTPLHKYKCPYKQLGSSTGQPTYLAHGNQPNEPAMQCASQLRKKSIFRIELTLESTLVSELSKDALKSENEQINYGQTVHTNVNKTLMEFLTLFPEKELERCQISHNFTLQIAFATICGRKIKYPELEFFELYITSCPKTCFFFGGGGV